MIHPFIPNSSPEIKAEMFRDIGISDIDDLLKVIPADLRFRGKLGLSESKSEWEVKSEISSILAKNRTCYEIPSFLGGGCWPHYVPEVCNEINSRSEFLTAYTGDVYTDLGRFQALFEYQSMIGDLVAMDSVTYPMYDWATALGDAVRMAMTSTGKKEILVPATASRERLSVMNGYCSEPAKIKLIDYDRRTGQMDLHDLRNKISENTAAVYVENPTYLGFIESEVEEIGKIAHDNKSLFIVGVEPLSLALLKPPGEYGADIVCGEGQPLGLKPYCGGALLGFVACRDEEKLVSSTGNRLITITPTERPGEHGFAFVLQNRSMFSAREKSSTFTGTTAVLWAITAAVYLSTLGPQGLRELSKNIMEKSNYAMKLISEISGIEVPIFDAPHFEEFTVRFPKNRTVNQINKSLLKRGIQGGKDLGRDYPGIENTALYCVTEVHSRADIDLLASSLAEVISGQ